jgi:hypothetical protein
VVLRITPTVQIKTTARAVLKQKTIHATARAFVTKRATADVTLKKPKAAVAVVVEAKNQIAAKKLRRRNFLRLFIFIGVPSTFSKEARPDERYENLFLFVIHPFGRVPYINIIFHVEINGRRIFCFNKSPGLKIFVELNFFEGHPLC